MPLKKIKFLSGGIIFTCIIIMKEINLVLSGGGARGIAHLGVIKALQEADFKIRAISAVSSGAIAGAFIAKGMTPDEIFEVALGAPGFNLSRPPFSLGLFNKKKMMQVLLKYFGHTAFSDLGIPLYISATNINTCDTDYFNTGEVMLPLIASSALPVFFSPVEINGYQYLDGGVINNLPVEPFLDDTFPIIGVHVNPLDEAEQLTSTFKIVERTIQITINKNLTQRKEHCTLIIEPHDLFHYTTYDFGRLKEIFAIGYEYAKISLYKYLEDGDKGQDFFPGMHAA
jgi:NTE family protein